MFNDLLSVRAMIEAPVDEGDDGVVVTVSVKALSADRRTEVVIVFSNRWNLSAFFVQ